MSIFNEAFVAPERTRPLRVAILGCTGSVGIQALDVCRQNSDKVQVVALAANSSVEKTVAAAQEFCVAHIAFADTAQKNNPHLADLPEGCSCGFGDDAVAELARLDCVDLVIVAVVGFAGIWTSYAALEANKIWAPANKEALVVGGDILMPLAKPGRVVPIDSEHSAIFQCLAGERRSDISKILLTCSGGPFFGKTADELKNVTAADALAHPTWKMGAKITIDCSTLMNKGFEVLEAYHLFGVPIDDVEVLVHRQSKIHSAVQFTDGSVKAQMGPSDMRIAIQYAMSYPERWQSPVEPTNWTNEQPLTFTAPDTATFRCLSLALEAGRIGGTIPCVVNAANEVMNEAFRKGACGFLDIAKVIEDVMNVAERAELSDLDQIAEVDAWARVRTNEILKALY